jgi:hypothetical protein
MLVVVPFLRKRAHTVPFRLAKESQLRCALVALFFDHHDLAIAGHIKNSCEFHPNTFLHFRQCLTPRSHLNRAVQKAQIRHLILFIATTTTSTQ